MADLSFSSIFSMASYLNGDLILIIAILLLIGAIAKSAQLGLHTWLASAMEIVDILPPLKITLYAGYILDSNYSKLLRLGVE